MGWCLGGVPLSHAECESEWSLVVGQRKPLEVEGKALNPWNLVGKGKDYVGKALVAESHPGSSLNGHKLCMSAGLESSWRPHGESV